MGGKYAITATVLDISSNMGKQVTLPCRRLAQDWKVHKDGPYLKKMAHDETFLQLSSKSKHHND